MPFRPMPLVTVMPAFVLASPPSHLPYWLAIFVPAALFFAWNPGLFRGKDQLPKRSWVLLTILTVLSIAYFVSSWANGIEYQGRTYTIVICVANFLWLAALWDLFRSARICRLGQVFFFIRRSLHEWLGIFSIAESCRKSSRIADEWRKIAIALIGTPTAVPGRRKRGPGYIQRR